jgi:branched-chain amino acid aminotransferase
MWIYLNDRFVEDQHAVVSVFDHGFLYGDGVYETLRAYAGRIFMRARHLARLRRSAALIQLDLPIPEARWAALLEEALARNGLSDAYLRITVSRGVGEIGLDPRLCPRPTIVIIAKPFQPHPPELYENGVTLAVVGVRRNHPSALSPQIKSLNFLNNILAKQDALRQGAFDGVMLHVDGSLAECTASNLFFVRNGAVQTPSLECGILDGVTREIVLQLAREAGLPVAEGRYPPDALRQADECFLTNTSMEIMPVRAVNGKVLGRVCPGPVTTRLRELFHSNLERFLQAP